MDKIYTIYHIPEFVYGCGSVGKIGVSYKLKTRINQNLKKSLEGFTKWEVLEEHTDVYEVSDREIELQKEYGYKVDCIPYWKTIENGLSEQSIKAKKQNAKNMSNGLTAEQRSKGGKVAYKINKKNGNMLKIQKLGGIASGKLSVESGRIYKMVANAKLVNSKPILQYSKDGKFIKEWNSISDCGRALSYDISSIAKVCKGKQKTAKGFVFKYKDEN